MTINDQKLIEVCSECKRASCWYGEFMCDGAKNASTIKMQISELRALDLESERFWSDEKLVEVYGSANPGDNNKAAGV